MSHRIIIISKLDGSKADCYTIDADLSDKELKRCQALLCNPLIEKALGFEFHVSKPAVEIGFLPGVTDNVGNTATEMLGHRTYFSQLYFQTPPTYNPLIQRSSRNEFLPVSRVVLPKLSPAQTIDLDVSDEELMRISKDRVLALNLVSMHVIRDFFKKIKREVTDVELETLAQTWSEHCKHTIFADPIDEIKDGLYRHYIKGATAKIDHPMCVSVFTDNSGAIAFDKDYLVTHKVETHNTPSALDPFGGAITGIVGVNRDCIGFGMGAKPIANVYGFCLADPKNKTVLYRQKPTRPNDRSVGRVLSARRIMDGVIAGINSGGNQSGIPTPQGFLHFNDRYLGKPLVFAGTIGLIPRKVPAGRSGGKGHLSHVKSAQPGDFIVMVGGRVGIDGIHGATFSSEELNPNSPSSAVQIGDPITQKKFSDAIVKEARDLGLYHSITDNGAGGLASSVGEMARDTDGCEVDLDKVPLKYPGLAPWQIWISESQERMTLAVPSAKWKRFEALMKKRGVEATVIGKFTKSGKCIVKYHGMIVMDIDLNFLHNGRPVKIQKTKKSHFQKLTPKTYSLKALLAHPNIASTAFVSQQYDTTVQGTAVVGPLQGRGMVNGNASVIAPVLGSKRGIVITQALAPELTEINSYEMAKMVIEHAIANAVAIGADPEQIALLDNFCWCSSDEPERLWQLKEACRACYDTAVKYGTPFISGKDSMFNDFKGFDKNGKPIKISIPPTLLISALGIIPDVTKAVTEDFKNPGDLIYVLRCSTPQLHKYYQAVQKNLISSAISIGQAGVAVALAKSAIAGAIGCDVKIRGDENGIIFSAHPRHKLVFAKKIGIVGGSDIKINDVQLSVKKAHQVYHATFENY